MDSRVLTIPPVERFPLRGFQLWKSHDGRNWTQIGENGFGNDNNFYGKLLEKQGILFIPLVNFKDGCELWWSKDGTNWERIYKQKEPSMTNMGGGPLFFKGHIYLCMNDISKGLEIWKSEP